MAEKIGFIGLGIMGRPMALKLRMLDGNYRPGFKARLHQKDMRIVMESAAEQGIALPGAALVTQLINSAVGQGMGEDDSIAIFRLQQALSALEINPS